MSTMLESESLEMIKLSSTNLKEELDKIIGGMSEGQKLSLFCENDFSKNLIDLMNEKYMDLPLKAKLLSEGKDGYIIKLVYPDSKGGGCCGCCS